MDLREHIEKLRKMGELLEVNAEVDWNLEASAITAMTQRVYGRPVLFNKIKGYPEGYRIMGNLFAFPQRQVWRNLAIVMDMDPEVGYEDCCREFARRLQRLIKPTVVTTGPCKEEIHYGKEANIFEFPIPYVHDGDGGRYFTEHVVITKDPDTDWQNWGLYRVMVHSKNRMGGTFQTGNQMAEMYFEYERRGQPMPFCMAIGGDPAIALAGGIALPVGMNEADAIGALRQAPIEVVKAETNNLLVPADAEIIIEGEVRPHERWDEGPFFEYDGFMNVPRTPKPVYRINCITHRKNPIMLLNPEGCEYNDTVSISAFHGPLFVMGLLRAGFPVRICYNAEETRCLGPAIAAKVDRPGIAGHMTNVVWSVGFSAWCNKLIITDWDVDVSNTGDVMEEIALRLHPVENILHTPHNRSLSYIRTFATEEEKMIGYQTNQTLDCTRSFTFPPEQRPRRTEIEQSYSKELQEWVKENFSRQGFQEKPKIKELKALMG